MAILHHENRQFNTVIDMRAIEVQPQDNDKFFCEETNLDYDYDPTLTTADDGLYIIALDNFPGRFQAIDGNCPTDIVDYNGHSFLGKIVTQNVIGYSFPVFNFPESYYLLITDLTTDVSNSTIYGDLFTFVNDLNNLLASIGNPTVFTSYINAAGETIIYAANPVANGLQIAVRNQTTGDYLTGGSLNPENDALKGQIPYGITIENPYNGEKCEIIRITNGTFNCANDEVLVKTPSGILIPPTYVPYYFGQTIAAAFAGCTDATNLFIHTFYAVQGGMSADSVDIPNLTIPFDNNFDFGVPALDVNQIQAAINLVLPSIGYAANDAIYTILNNNEIVIWYAPAFAANVVNNDYLHMYGGPIDTPGGYINKVDFTVVSSATQGDIQLPAVGSSQLKWAKLPCPQSSPIPKPIISIKAYQEPQHFRSTSGNPPTFADNNFKYIIKYPDGYPDFEAKVATGNVRLQLIQFDGRAYMKHKDINGNVTDKVRLAICPKYPPHRNGTLDAGDYIFGGNCRDSGGNLYPDRDTMIMIPNTLKPNQYVEFELDPALWYGYGTASNCGLISTNLPMTIEDYFTSDLTVRCGGSKKNHFSFDNTVEKNDRIYFQFVFMFKNADGRWEQSVAGSDKFFIEFKYANTDDGAGNTQKWIIGFRSKLT